ncbi:glutaminase [Sporichthya polymorpha]|uniref:glutaminase n=1 Tax=Sporichthya polymorpha TaxID=35751 RepID=UPI00036384B9|nr:glutaminase [Sporichthya polymorpha]
MRTLDLDALLPEIAAQVQPLARQGQQADYIPALADADPNRFALATCDLTGAEHAVGDADVPFAIQSIAKVFSLTLALQHVGEDLWKRVDREPSGDPFNSLIQLELDEGVPRNPMINAGALAVCDVLLERCDDPDGEVRALLSELCGEPIGIDDEIREAERRAGHRNTAMAHLMSAFGNLHTSVEAVMSTYAGLCAVTMTTRQLARAIRFLANGGVDPKTGHRVVPEALARRINAVMLTCGTYDSAGQFAYEVGLPCKSGVAGAIVADAPGRLGMCAWSPPLDASGNSRAGGAALHLLAERAKLSVF